MSLGILNPRGQDPGCQSWGKGPITWRSQVKPALAPRAEPLDTGFRPAELSA